MRVLVVEDDPKIAGFICKGLEAEQHHVETCNDGIHGLETATRGQFDLIILDIMLPGMNGFDFLKKFRETEKKTLVIAVTARGEVEDRVRGLDVGADDYIVKPFSFVELLARIRALFRRIGDAEMKVESGPFSLDRLKQTVSYEDKTIELTKREFQLLAYFLQHNNEVLTRAMIADRVWGYQFDTGTNVVDVYVNYLRKKLKPFNEEQFIQTVRGIGYIFKDQVELSCDKS
ncbi:MAG: response regulator transcription factor [Planctomycetota bacterium]|nr:response regulator transcription factor [Planctomycetota bacterium]